ncbi:Uncharacterised protein [Legionella lansingensis]|uniref:Dot/Icm secretion system substrate n=1 Tax=Legionella lansingensis TaxID=45067 RepID=A0A0W0VQ80_9GAMM|nr:hypothetical protein [Legionella lansingensis]KTD22170.1 hypothetical protein Llan_1433 [Legionella lansingensis]SNV54660.1 Uncharacterised protein [Legionella lansingensis]
MSAKLYEVDPLTESVDDYHTKTEVINFHKQMKAMALQGDAVAAYRLARDFPQNSDDYLKWLKKAADSGLTNAKLDLAISLAQSKSVSKLQQAADYFVQVLRSKDRFIKDQAEDFLSQNRSLFAEVTRQMNGNKITSSSNHFFAPDPARVEDNNQVLAALKVK